jgi:hypothetical protein
MFSRHISEQLAAHLDGQLSPAKAQQAVLHLEHCAQCRTECEQVRLGMAIVEHLPLVEAPAAIWTAIEAAARESQSRRAPVYRAPVYWWRWAFAAAVVLAVAGVAVWRSAHPAGPQWEVVRRDGVGQAGAGDWIETDATSRATVKVGQIGSVEVEPNTRVRIVSTRPGDHRLALARGEIRAKITAPPRLFFVDTASGTAVDLGCEYTLSTSEDGAGLLQVTKGWVSFEWHGLESLVPAGASCRTHPKTGPGIPYFDDASDSLKQALDRNDALSVILAESRVRDTLTLWHLLQRVDAADRERVFDRMAALTRLPTGVSRESALALDPETLKRWKEELAWTW